MVSRKGEPVFISYEAGAFIDASEVTNTIVVSLGARDYINLDNGDESEESLGSSGNTIIAFGNNTDVEAGGSNGNTIYLLGKNDSLEGYNTASNIHVEGKNAQISIGTKPDGENSIYLDSTSANVAIASGGHADSEFPFGDDNVIASGAGSATVTGGADNFNFSGAEGHYDISGGVAANSVISGGSGGGTFTRGWYNTERIFGDGDPILVGNNTITAGTQSSTVVGSEYGTSTLIAAGKAGDVLIAGEFGNDTISAGSSTGNNTYEGFTGTPGSDYNPDTATVVIQAGSGNDTLIGGFAPETLTGGAGSDIFRFQALFEDSFGNVPTTLITDFTRGVDKLDIAGESSRQIIAQETVSGGSTLLALSNGTSITLAHVTGLATSDFTHS